MCGIAGVFTGVAAGDHAPLVERIVTSQVRRGPDHQAVEAITGPRARLVVGHDRLSIIDLSPAAHQPLWDASHRYCTVFNGEIYNYPELREELTARGHRFTTRSDTEVLVESFRAWGAGAIERFNGMFAFALFDAEEERLFLARDRFGIKPLYYLSLPDTLAFASTGAVIADWGGLGPDLEHVARGLRYGVYDGEDHAPYQGLKALKPGHYLEATVSADGRVTTDLRRYYDLAGRVAALADELAGRPTAELVARIDELLGSAVDLRFRSDVPVAVSLSGGLDSSSIAAAAHRRGRGEVIGFTFGHPDDPRSEAPIVQRLARQTGIGVRYVWPEMREIVGSFLATLQAQDAPFTGASVMAQYLVYKEVRASGVRVLLGGQGGDEVFMGYRKFQVFHLRSLIRRKRYGDALGFAASLVPTALAEARNLDVYLRELPRYRRDGAGGATVLDLPRTGGVSLGSDPEGPMWRRQADDLAHASLPTLLRYEDANSMGNSVESRLPFLDYRLVEYGLALPVTAKLRGGYGKWAVREAVKRRIPESIRSARYKRGFDVQQAAWISRGLGGAVRELLRHGPDVRTWLPRGATIDALFSDAELIRRRSAFTEATSLIWLASRAGRGAAQLNRH